MLVQQNNVGIPAPDMNAHCMLSQQSNGSLSLPAHPNYGSVLVSAAQMGTALTVTTPVRLGTKALICATPSLTGFIGIANSKSPVAGIITAGSKAVARAFGKCLGIC